MANFVSKKEEQKYKEEDSTAKVTEKKKKNLVKGVKRDQDERKNEPQEVF
ncbi:MAG: hypothetical protein PVH61_27365 [Candidatus Aminicenantes bacterium]|jgi:hypothetical protein